MRMTVGGGRFLCGLKILEDCAGWLPTPEERTGDVMNSACEWCCCVDTNAMINLKFSPELFWGLANYFCDFLCISMIDHDIIGMRSLTWI